MTHRHEWTVLFNFIQDRLFAYCHIGSCEAELECDEIERRLNATEFLSTEDADISARLALMLPGFGDIYNKLMAYAKTLRGE